MKVVLLAVIGLVVVVVLGPVVGAVELGVIAALDGLAIALVLRHDRKQGAAGT